MEKPKLFISYSWSNPAHEQWVISLATDLVESGVDVILDKWDLKEGDDAFQFMEKMVTDPEISKVAIICDEVYAQKADGRSGGVGTETQIISREVYEDQERGKFVAIIPEKDDQGKAHLPTYFKSRIYIDLSEPDNHAESFERLLRWIYNKPLYTKPDIGKMPSFLDESKGVSLGTSATYKRALSAIRESKAFAVGALNEYLTTFVTNLEKFRISSTEKEFDDQVIDSIEKFIPFRNEAISIFSAVATYDPSEENISKFHKFFEDLIYYLNCPKNVSSWRETDFDNFKFIVHELFLYFVAILIKNERFKEINHFLIQQYYIEGASDYGKTPMIGYSVFQTELRSLDHRKRRLNLNRASLQADLIKQRAQHSSVEFRYLMQADFVLFLRGDVLKTSYYYGWYPISLVYIDTYHGAFEVFARSSSKVYFEKAKCILGIDKPSDLDSVFEMHRTNSHSLPGGGFRTIDPSSLVGYKQLAEQP